MASSIGAHAQPAPSSAIGDIFGPIRKLFGTILYVLIFILIVVVSFFLLKSHVRQTPKWHDVGKLN